MARYYFRGSTTTRHAIFYYYGFAIRGTNRGVAKRLRSSLREEDTLARLNSDEFAIIQSGLTRPEDAVLLCRRLLEGIGDSYLLDGHSVVIGATIGIAMAPGDGDDAEKLLKNADMALSRAKNESRGTFSFFEAGMDARAQSRRKIEIDLRAEVRYEERHVTVAIAPERTIRAVIPTPVRAHAGKEKFPSVFHSRAQPGVIPPG